MKKLIIVTLLCIPQITSAGTISDVLYFPGGNIGINKSKDQGSQTPIDWRTFWNKYDILYYGSSKAENPNHEKLFRALYFEIETQHKLNFKIFSHNETQSLLEDMLVDYKLEVEVSKFRYKNNAQADKDEKDIRNKLNPLLELQYQSHDKTTAGLRIDDTISKKVCGVDISGNFRFETVYLNNENVTDYYLFGYRSWGENFYYGSPWDDNHTSNAFIIQNQFDLKNINTSKFFFKKIEPQFKKQEYKETYYDEGDDNIYIPKGGAVLTQAKEYEKVLSTNSEAHFALTQENILDYFIQHGDLYKFQNEYSFGPDEGTSRKYTFVLLGVENDGDVRVLSGRKPTVKLDISDTVNGADLDRSCTAYYKAEHSKNIYYTNQKIDQIFESYDKKYKFTEYQKYSRFPQPDTVLKELSIRNKKSYITYSNLLDSLLSKIDSFEHKNNASLQILLNGKRSSLMKNSAQIERIYTIKNILSHLKSKLMERKRPLDNILR